MKLKIDPDYENLLPKLTDEQYQGLERDIMKRGILSPIIIWNDFIVDGHNRYAIALKHKIEDIPTREVEFQTKSDAIEWIINHQANRRNLKKSQLLKAWKTYEAELTKEAAERMSPGINQYTKRSTTNLMQTKGDEKSTSNLMQISDKPKRNPTVAAEVAKKMGVSENTFRDMKLITEQGTQGQIERMDKGGRGNGVNTIANEVRNKDVPDGMKRCQKCKRILPVSDFYSNGGGRLKSQCKECHNKRNRSKDIHGNIIKIPNEYREISNQRIIDGLIDSDLPSATISDVVNEFMANFQNYMGNLIGLLNGYEALVKENKKEITKMWDVADDEFQKIRKEYV